MFPLIILLKKIRQRLKGAFYGAIASTFIIIIYGTMSEFYIENQFANSGVHSLFESLWWVIQTITTVGYGDVPIVSFWGKVNAMFIMLVGIGSLGILTASIGANLVEMNLAAKLGERRIRMKEHVILCNYDDGVGELVRRVNESGMDVVLVDSDDPKIHDVTYSFVRGRCSVENDLGMAGISNASKVVIVPERGIQDSSAADAKTILTTMVVRKVRNDAYIVAEVLKGENREHCILAGANEVVIRGAMSILLLANAITSPGVSKLFYELLRGEDGYVIREYPVESTFMGRESGEIYQAMESEGRVVLGFRNEDDIRIRPAVNSKISWKYVVLMEPKGLK